MGTITAEHHTKLRYMTWVKARRYNHSKGPAQSALTRMVFGVHLKIDADTYAGFRDYRAALGLFQTQILRFLHQILVINLENNLKGITDGRQDIGGGVLTVYGLSCAALKPHFPDRFH